MDYLAKRIPKITEALPQSDVRNRVQNEANRRDDYAPGKQEPVLDFHSCSVLMVLAFMPSFDSGRRYRLTRQPKTGQNQN